MFLPPSSLIPAEIRIVYSGIWNVRVFGGTCMCSRERAKNAGVLRCPIVNLHDVIQGRLEEGELTEDH